MTAAITVFEAVRSVHVMAGIIAFGVFFAWPLLPAASGHDHHAVARILRLVVTPAGLVVFATGAYMATDRGVWDEPWVSTPVLILFVIFGAIGAYLVPSQRKLAQLADEPDTASHAALQARVTKVALACALLTLVAVFVMETKL